MLQREGFARFSVVGLGEDPGLFLPVALSGKFNVCSTTDCSYYVNSAGSIQCTVKGSPPRIRVCIKENLCAARFEWYRSQPNVSSILVDVWVIGYLENVGLLIFVVGFWFVGLLIFVVGFWFCWFIDFRRWILVLLVYWFLSLDSDLLV